MAEFSASGERFDIGRVLSRTFSAIMDNWKVLGSFALIGGVLAAVANGLSMSAMLQTFDPTNPQAALGMFTSPGYWGGLIGGLLIGAFMQSGLTSGLLNGSASLGECVSGAMRYFLPLLGLTILWGLGVGLGWILLVVPGLILLTMWSVAVPALIADNTGVIGAFGRSRALTKGLRWQIFGTLLVFLILLIFFSFAVQGFSTSGMINLYRSNFVLALLVGVIANIITSLLLTSFLVSLYKEVVQVKEGTGQSGLAEIFN